MQSASPDQPCSSTQERWGACRSRVYGEERVRDFAWCNLWMPYLTRERALLGGLSLRHRRPCTSPRRNHCRRGTTRPGRDQQPDRWNCRQRVSFLGPLRHDPISDVIWYERPPSPYEIRVISYALSVRRPGWPSIVRLDIS